MATPLRPIECSAQPLSFSFHPSRDLVAAGLCDGTVELHDVVASPIAEADADDDVGGKRAGDDQSMDGSEVDTILSSIYVARKSQEETQMLAKVDGERQPSGKAKQGPSCRCVLFSDSSQEDAGDSGDSSTDEKKSSARGRFLYTACNHGSIRCLDTEKACRIQPSGDDGSDEGSHDSIVWSIENAHAVGINRLYQLPPNSPCGDALVSGDDAGNIRIWDTSLLHDESRKRDKSKKPSDSNPFDGLMQLPTGCLQHWKIHQDYVTDFEVDADGKTLFATCADGTLSVLDLRFVKRKNTQRSVERPEVDLRNPDAVEAHIRLPKGKTTWDVHGYVQSDNQEDELLSCCLVKKGTKLLCGSQEGILSIFTHGKWGDISDRFPGHPSSIDALLRIDDDTVLTGSSDGLVRAVQLLPNQLLGVLGGHDGFPVEALGWGAKRAYVGSLSHDENIRLWDGSFLKDDDEDMDDDEEGGKVPSGLAGASTKGEEDDWEDMDEDDSDSDDSDSDDSDEGGGGGKKAKKREKMFKTANEEFFSDL